MYIPGGQYATSIIQICYVFVSWRSCVAGCQATMCGLRIIYPVLLSSVIHCLIPRAHLHNNSCRYPASTKYLHNIVLESNKWLAQHWSKFGCCLKYCMYKISQYCFDNFTWALINANLIYAYYISTVTEVFRIFLVIVIIIHCII